ncbi:ABC transporter substrate-binding protein [Blastochloris viridis]|uniref:Solute-binding protein family 3/N-terminal domain-containing protein n=1 Tax=Blastochloris viridis TaxID=1079 RepID=A0A0H5BD89_BLAVI|nr:ABC transporter substrate-binding protein [Blastochloris viridis]ALK09897.1 Putative ABC transporter periplasmic binding protein precursor [Blastochloris viridis]BAS00198.1 hypothetical protein BV133_2604 [Blastochloris viridis]CUU42560.1 hypothetical protein BVIRIDIS_15730 [Blastochloris viridis]
MKLFRHAFLVALGLLASVPAKAEDVVRLGNLKFAHYGAVSYMKEIGPKYGLKIEERVFAKGLDIQPAIIAGEIDIGASALEAAIAGRAGGVPIFAVAGFARGGARIVARPGLGITSIADLKGKKVGVTRGGPQELLLIAELRQHGLTWSDKPGKDVQVLYMVYPDLNQALAAGNLDVISQSEPYASQLLNRNLATEVIKPYDTPMGEPMRALVMSEKFYTEKPDVALRTLMAFVEATSAFIADPALAETYVRTSMFKGQISAEDFRDAMNNAAFTYDLTVDQVDTVTRMMQETGVGRMAKPPVAAEWVKVDLLEKAKASLKK